MSRDLRVLLGDLVTVNQRLTRVAARAAGGTESPAIWRTVGVLRTGGPMRLGELAEQSRVSQPTATNLVSTLVERGWLARQPDPRDARATLIEATPAGLAALSQWRDELATAMLPLFDGLSDDDTEVLYSAVQILSERVETSEPGARP